MRCLYCGKELALFKKLTGGSEFCSEEHRQRYHDEYNRLALSRLLQAPAAEAEATGATGGLRQRENAPAPLTVGGRRLLESEPAAPEPAVAEAAAEPAPPAGFLTGLAVTAQGSGPRPRGGDVRAENRLESRNVARPELRIDMRGSLEELLGPREAGEPVPARRAGVLPVELKADPGPAAAVVWSYPARDFRPAFELRETLRLQLRTSGIGLEPEDTDEQSVTGLSVSISALGHNIAWDRDAAEEQAEPESDAAGAELEEIEIPSLWDTPLNGGAAGPGEMAAAVPVPVAQPAPLKALEPLVVPVVAAAPGRPKAHQVYSASGLAEQIAFPRLGGYPLRPVILLGPKPEAAPAAEIAPVSEAKAAVSEAKAPVSEATAPASETKSPVSEAKAPVRGEAAPAAQPESPAPSGPGESGEGAAEGTVGGRLSRRERARLAKRTRGLEAAAEKPPATETAPPAKAEPAPAAAARVAPPQPAAAKREEPALAARTVEPAAKPAVAPAPAAPVTPVKIEAPSFGMTASGAAANDGGLPMGVKIAAAAGGVAVLAAIAYFALSGGGASAPAEAVVREAPMLAMTEGSWATDWAASEIGGRPRRIAFYRATQALSDYRISFRGEIPGRSLGWIFRAADPKNYHASRLEVLKRGLNPTVVLVRYAVINGEETAPTQIPLPMPVRIDTVYRIQVEALGNKFQTTVLGQVVDKWTDDRLKSGGVGLMYDRGDPMPELRSLAVTPLIIQGKKK